MDDKNKKNPLKRMGAKPNPTFFQKANILFKAINKKNNCSAGNIMEYSV